MARPWVMKTQNTIFALKGQLKRYATRKDIYSMIILSCPFRAYKLIDIPSRGFAIGLNYPENFRDGLSARKRREIKVVSPQSGNLLKPNGNALGNKKYRIQFAP